MENNKVFVRAKAGKDKSVQAVRVGDNTLYPPTGFMETEFVCVDKNNEKVASDLEFYKDRLEVRKTLPKKKDASEEEKNKAK